jgi:hypothetical protein
MTDIEDLVQMFATATVRKTQTVRGRKQAEKAKAGDGRKGRATGRVVQLNVRVTPEWKAEVTAHAERHGLLLVEMLERAWESYIRGKQ